MLVRSLIFLALNMLDVLLTMYATHLGDGCVYEANPICGYVLDTFGFSGLTVYKIIGIALFVPALYCGFGKERATKILGLICWLFGGLMVYMLGLAVYCTIFFS